LCDYYWNLNLNFFYNLSSFVNVVRYFHYLLNFTILYFRHLNYLFYLFQVSHFDNSLNRDFSHNLFPLINWNTFLTNYLNFSRVLNNSVNNYFFFDLYRDCFLSFNENWHIIDHNSIYWFFNINWHFFVHNHDLCICLFKKNGSFSVDRYTFFICI